MLRRVAIAAAIAVFAGGAAVPADAQLGGPPPQAVDESLLMPGVTYERQVEFTPHGPVVLDVVIGPRPDNALYTLTPVLSNDAIVGTETLTDMEKALSASATVVGVNADFFSPNPGEPSGLLLRNGVLDSAPLDSRSSLGIGADGTLTVDRVSFDGTWLGTGQRRQLDLNAPPAKGHTTLYTPAWGAQTPTETGVVVDVIPSLPPLTPNRIVSGVVSEVGSGGPTPIPPGGAVLVARGNQAPHLTAEAPAGTTVEIRPTLTPDWSAMLDAVGGGPLLVTQGKPIFRAREAFGDPVLNRRSARSAVGQLADGRIVLATVEGGGPAYSAGMTNFELAVALARLGVETAMGLGTGTTATMAFDGTALTEAPQQPIADALVLSYAGVYAAPPAADVLSPNGDGVDDVQTFSYKLVRPSQLTATLVAPDGSTQVLAQDAEQPGVHTLQWDGKGAAEGDWRFTVTATDDLGRTTTAERPFAVNDTLSSLQVGGGAVSFQLAHAALVTVTVENRNGIVVSSLLARKLAAGAQSVPWNGKGGSQIRVTATNSIGTASLVAPTTAKRS